jgi:4-amino-4-deoxy-L-arabinose transferase-like glycosyltransferase
VLRRIEQTVLPLIIILALAGIATMLLATRWGIGLTPDSVGYIEVARNLLHGLGLRTQTPDGAGAFTMWPPLYPTLLAVIGLLGVDPLYGARWLNALLFGANIVLVGYMIRRFANASRLAPVFGSFLVLTSVDMLSIHSAALTEPAFIFFTLLGLFWLGVHIETSQALLAAAAATGLAFLTRFSGLALVAAGALAILWLGRQAPRRRMRDSLVFAVISALPMVLWAAWSMRATGSPGGRAVAFHPVTIDHAASALRTLSTWLLPMRAPEAIREFLLLGMIAGGLLLGVLIWKAPARQAARGSATSGSRSLLLLLGLYIASYLALLIVYLSLFNVWSDIIDGRILSPVYVTGVVLTICLAHRMLRSAGELSRLRLVVAALCIVFAGSYLVRATARAQQYYDQGRGYASRHWKQPETIGVVRTLPPGLRIYSNGPDAIYILAEKRAEMLPARARATVVVTPEDYLAQLRAMREEVAACRAVIVYFRAIDWRPHLLPEAELRQLLPLREIQSPPDGTLYEGAHCR